MLLATGVLRWLVIMLIYQINSGLSIRISKDYIIDLLKPIPWNQTGVTTVATPTAEKTSTTYLFKGSKRCLSLSNKLTLQVREIMEKEDFTIIAKLKQHRRNSGSLLSITVKGERYFEVQSHGKKHELRLYYTNHDHVTRVQKFAYQIADNQWHSLALSFSGNRVSLYIDCQKLYDRVLLWTGRKHDKFNSTLWIGQRNSRQAMFKGALEEIKLVDKPQGYLLQCPHLDKDCPSCNRQFKELELSVASLYVHIEELTKKLQVAESRILELSQCDCMKTCEDRGMKYRDGEIWQKGHCTHCTCTNGVVKCEKQRCNRVKCAYPVLLEGHCCPTCLRYCFYGGIRYDHGEGYTWYNPRNGRCVKCSCQDGKMSCASVRSYPRSCPALNCPRSKQFIRDGDCCKHCSETSFDEERKIED